MIGQLSPLSIEISSGRGQIRLDAAADGAVDETLEHRILLLDSGVKRKNLNLTTLIKEEVERDGTALANRLRFTVISNHVSDCIGLNVVRCLDNGPDAQNPSRRGS